MTYVVSADDEDTKAVETARAVVAAVAETMGIPKTAVQLDLHGGWRTIINNTRKSERKALNNLLEQAVKYFYSEGMALDPSKSYLGVKDQASDGLRLEGFLHITEEHNNIPATKQRIEDWVEAACGLRGSAKQIGVAGPHRLYTNQVITVWEVDISDY